MPRKPRVFIGSSKESLNLAHVMQVALDEKMEVTVWDQGIFEISSYSIDDLIEEAHRSDFGIFVFSPDDSIFIRGNDFLTVRDNVLFELGLFMGILGRRRVFVVAPAEVRDFRIPSDMYGLVLATYRSRSDNNMKAAFGPACSQILEAASKIFAADPEPGCAYMHTEESTQIIPLDSNTFSITFHPPMRCSPTLKFIGEAGEVLLPMSIDYWSRYGFTVRFATSLLNVKWRFIADARPQ